MTSFGRLAKGFDFLADRKPSMMLTFIQAVVFSCISKFGNRGRYVRMNKNVRSSGDISGHRVSWSCRTDNTGILIS